MQLTDVTNIAEYHMLDMHYNGIYNYFTKIRHLSEWVCVRVWLQQNAVWLIKEGIITDIIVSPEMIDLRVSGNQLRFSGDLARTILNIQGIPDEIIRRV